MLEDTVDKIKVLILAGTFTTGGVESVIMNIIRNCDRNRFAFDIIALRKAKMPFDDELKKIGVNIILHPPIHQLGLFKYCHSLFHTIKSSKYDIVHINGVLSSALNLIIVWMCRIKKRIFHAHNTQDQILEYFHNERMKNGIIFLLRTIINHLSTDRLACGIEASKFVYGEKHTKGVQIIYNAIDLNTYSPIDYQEHIMLKKRLNVDDSTLILGNAARFTKVKNQLFIIKLLQYYIKNISDNVLLLLAGDGVELNTCKEYVEENDLIDKVKFLGNIMNMKKFYDSIDIFLLPSFYEGLPVTAIEAQACGIPIIASDCVTREVDQKMGLVKFCNLDNKKEWIKQINLMAKIRIYDKDEVLNKLNQYSVKKMVKRIEKIYSDSLFDD